MKTTPINSRRLTLFLVFSFGISWLTALVIYLTGGLVNSPMVIPSMNITLAVLLLATAYMFAPAIANLLTRLITREGFKHALLKPKLQSGWKYWLIAWFSPAILTLLGALVYFLVFPKQLDLNMTLLYLQLQSAGQAGVSVWVLFAAQVVQAVIISPLVNGISTFGEEFGWRGYLLPKLMPLGGRKAVLLSGVIWGLWHAPIILMGHNYGFDYAGATWLGAIVMIWFCVVLGVFFSWLTLRAGSVYPAVIAHAAVNGIAVIGFLLMRMDQLPHMLLGPSAAGLLGSAGFLVAAVLIFLKPKSLLPVLALDEADEPHQA